LQRGEVPSLPSVEGGPVLASTGYGTGTGLVKIVRAEEGFEADGRIYLRYQDGRMILLDAEDEEYKERGTFVIPEVAKASWSHPAIADGILFLREQDNLFAYDIRARGGSSGKSSGR
jgi:hypothetical protein